MLPCRAKPLPFPKALEALILKTVAPGPRTGQVLRELWPRLARQRGRADGDAHYGDEAEAVKAYALYYLTANALKLPLILEEAAVLGLATTAPLRVLDLGCGPGTVLAGAWWWAQSQGVTLESAAGFDRSREFLRLAGRLMAAAGAPWVSLPGDLSEEAAVVAAIEKTKPTLVVASNSLSEVPGSAEARAGQVARWIAALASLAETDGIARTLVLIEPGAKEASRELHELRRCLLADTAVARVATVALPCLDARPCGALDSPGDWCHEAVEAEFPEWHEKLGREAGLRKEHLLFSYLVLRVGPEPRVPASWPVGASRVVSQRMHEKGLVKCFACTAGGRKLARVLDSRATPENEVFRKAFRGQLYARLDLGEKGDVLAAEPVTACRLP